MCRAVKEPPFQGEILTKYLGQNANNNYPQGFPGGSDGEESTCNSGDLGSIPGLGRSPGGENGNHSSILAWRIPWTEEPGGLSSMVSERVRQTEDACTRVKPGLLVCGHTLFLQQWSSAGAAFCICPLLQGTTGNVWRLFWCHDWGHVPGI